jgi:Right handed beta helix region
MSMRLTACVLILTYGAIIGASSGADYYVSPAGNDAAQGGKRKPWKTIERVNRAALKPGDRVLFEGGKTFTGTILLDGGDRGTAERKVMIGSFGQGKATIDGGNGRALSVEGCDHLQIRGLRFLGSGRKTGNTESGLYLSHAAGMEIDDVEVVGFRSAGIHINGVQGARITRAHVHENGFSGIASDGDLSRDLYVAHCLAENNPGDPSIRNNHSGNGIVLGKVQDAVIEYCEARHNGWDMPRKGNGPVGIWTWAADRVTIQFCISHHNRSTGTDGGGFDFDGGVTNSVLQYNYSHDNHGSGYLICQYRGATPFRNNIVRYNISQDDGLTNHNAGIYVWVGGADMESTDVYNNTIFNSKGAAVAFGGDPKYATPRPRMTFLNNIFVSGEAQIEGGSNNGRFEGNLYWAMGDGGFLVDGYNSLEAWAAATGQETIGGTLVGCYADPLLRKNGTGLLTDPALLPNLPEYQILEGSPAIDAGLDLRELFKMDPGMRDFFGNAIPHGPRFDIGAHEYTGQHAGSIAARLPGR